MIEQSNLSAGWLRSSVKIKTSQGSTKDVDPDIAAIWNAIQQYRAYEKESKESSEFFRKKQELFAQVIVAANTSSIRRSAEVDRFVAQVSGMLPLSKVILASEVKMQRAKGHEGR